MGSRGSSERPPKNLKEGGEVKKKKSRAKYSSYFFGHHSDGCCCFYGGTVCSGRQLPKTHLVSQHPEINSAIRTRLAGARMDFVFLFFSSCLPSSLISKNYRQLILLPVCCTCPAVPAEVGRVFLSWRVSAQAPLFHLLTLRSVFIGSPSRWMADETDLLQISWVCQRRLSNPVKSGWFQRWAWGKDLKVHLACGFFQ